MSWLKAGSSGLARRAQYGGAAADVAGLDGLKDGGAPWVVEGAWCSCDVAISTVLSALRVLTLGATVGRYARRRRLWLEAPWLPRLAPRS